MKRLKYIFTVIVALLVFVPSPVYAVSPGQISGKQAQWFCESFVALTGYAIPDYDSSKPNSQQYQVFMDFYGDCYRWCADHAVDFGNPVSNHINFYGNGADYLAATVSGNHTLIEHNLYGLFDVPDWVVVQLQKYAKSKKNASMGDYKFYQPFKSIEVVPYNRKPSNPSTWNYQAKFTLNDGFTFQMRHFYQPSNIEYFTNAIIVYDVGSDGTVYNSSELGFDFTYKGQELTFQNYVSSLYENQNVYHGMTPYVISVQSFKDVPTGKVSYKRYNNNTEDDVNNFDINVRNLNNEVSTNFKFAYCVLLDDGYHIAFCKSNSVGKTQSYLLPTYKSGGLKQADNAPSVINYNYYFNYAGDTQNINNYNNVVYNIDNSVTNNYQQLPDDSTSDLLPWMKNIAQNLLNLSQNFNNWTTQLGQLLNHWYEGVYSRLENIYAALLNSQVVPDAPKDADITRLKDSIDDFQKVAYKYFPFSVPWDMYTMISFFSAPPEAPKFDVPYINADYSVGKYHIDLTPFDDAAKTARAGMRVVFDFGLLWLFKKLSDDTPIG